MAVTGLVSLVALLVALTGLVAVEAGRGASAAYAAPAGRTYGLGPYQSVMAAAGQYARPDCGLSQNRLAAMMMVPTFTETGATTSQSPSPMTLSRWDTQAALWAFGDKATPYQRAFFHPGIGMWQFDSAGGWNLTAGTAINTQVSAGTAAQVMSSRFCSAAGDVVAKMRSGWFPWNYCTSGQLCLDVLDSIFDGTNLFITTDASVGPLGGMVHRSCRVAGIGDVICGYVDPAQAQGNRGWTSQSPSIPTPLSAPFYVFSANGREYRYWLRNDTGYDSTIVASKPITANARTSLTWSKVTGIDQSLCDLTAVRGNCGPFGTIDMATSLPGLTVHVGGWAIDPDGAASVPVPVQITVDGAVAATVTANGARPDVGAVYPAAGPNHGFDLNVAVPPGAHQLCVIAVDSVAPVVANSNLGCRSVVGYTGAPIGAVDSVTLAPNAVRVTGWAMDADTAASIPVHVYVDSVGVAGTASLSRPDLAVAYPHWGANHGFDITVTGLTPGRHGVCTFAINAGPALANPILGCTTVTVPDGSPVGAVESAQVVNGQLRVTGWTLDPETTAVIPTHVYVDGRGVAAVADKPHAAIPGYAGWGTNHGFDVSVPVGPGRHEACVFGINSGAGTNTLIECRTVVVPSPASNANPIGNVDEVRLLPNGILVTGWTLDPDTFGSIQAHVYVDGVGRAVVADGARPDLAAAFPAWGPAHGFATSFTGLARGAHQVCIFGFNVGAGASTLLRCVSFVLDGSPVGKVDYVSSPAAGSLRLVGWVIDPDTTGPAQAHIYVDGVGVAVVANGNRPDIGGAYPAYGPNHGFDTTISGLAPGGHDVCVYGFNTGSGFNTVLQCGRVNL